MSETMVRVTNISDRERVVNWDGMPYALAAGKHRDVSPVLGKHFQKRHAEFVTVAPLTTLHVAPEAPQQTRKCQLCSVEFQDTEEFITHLAPCAIATAQAQAPKPAPAEPEAKRVLVTINDESREATVLGHGKNGFSRVKLDDGGSVVEVPNKTLTPLA